jgi:hypothetical protein
MKHTRILAALSAVAVAGTLGGCSGGRPDSASAESATPQASSDRGNADAQRANLPDWSGAWEPIRFVAPDAAGGPKPPQLTPKYAPQFAAYQEKNRTTPGINFVSTVSNCIPPGLPVIMQQPYPIEFLFTPGRVTIITESYSMVRRVYTDGSELPPDPDPTYLGTSVGHWEGDTLIIETAGILPETSPLAGITGHSDKMRVTERVRQIEPDVLEITTTVDDPAVFVEPYTSVARYQRHRDWKIMEYVCAQNNHDSLDEHGNPAFSLERNPGK